jgi:hypothetical protein
MFAQILPKFRIAGISDDSPEYLTISCEREHKFLNPGVEPVFREIRRSVSSGAARAFEWVEIRVLDSTGNIERTIVFNETDRKL